MSTPQGRECLDSSIDVSPTSLPSLSPVHECLVDSSVGGVRPGFTLPCSLPLQMDLKVELRDDV